MTKLDYLAMFMLAACCVVNSVYLLKQDREITRLRKRMDELEKKDRQFLAVKSTLVL